jgi:uncharacterized membrane protein YeiH
MKEIKLATIMAAPVAHLKQHLSSYWDAIGYHAFSVLGGAALPRVRMQRQPQTI